MPQLSLPVAQSLSGSSSAQDTADLATRYREVRSCTESLCGSLATEDFIIQSMPDASPVKWHLAHTSWFFETFVLLPGLPDYQPFHPQFSLLFNSYYNAVGERWPRPQRGLLSRPTVADVFRYRAHVDERIAEFLNRADARTAELRETIVLGLHHEQQHQELIITDLKNAFANNPLHPVYREAVPGAGRPYICAGYPIPKESTHWATRAPALRSITSCPGIACSCRTSSWPAGRSPMRSIWSLWKMAATSGRTYGWRKAGRRGRSAAGRRPCTGTGTKAGGSRPRWRGSGRLSLMSRSVMSVIMRRTPLRAGPARGCPRRPNGRRRRRTCLCPVIFWRRAAFIRRRPRRQMTTGHSSGSTATSGSGRRVPIPAIRDTSQRPERWANTTVSSCATN